MKFDKPRVFRNLCCNSVVAFDDDQSERNCSCAVGWKYADVIGAYESEWKLESEVAPTDITKLDCAGVFHEVPKPEPEAWRFFYCRESPQDIAVNAGPLKGDHGDRFIEFPRPDIANATIAELRARVTELEGELNLTRHDLQKILFRSGCILRVDLANEAADAGEVRA